MENPKCKAGAHIGPFAFAVVEGWLSCACGTDIMTENIKAHEKLFHRSSATSVPQSAFDKAEDAFQFPSAFQMARMAMRTARAFFSAANNRGPK